MRSPLRLGEMFQIDLRTFFFFNSDGSKTNYRLISCFLIFGKMADFQPAMDLLFFQGNWIQPCILFPKIVSVFCSLLPTKILPLEVEILYMVHLNIQCGDSYWEGDQPEM